MTEISYTRENNTQTSYDFLKNYYLKWKLTSAIVKKGFDGIYKWIVWTPMAFDREILHFILNNFDEDSKTFLCIFRGCLLIFIM